MLNKYKVKIARGIIASLVAGVIAILTASSAYAGLEGEGSGLMGWWKFDEGSGTSVYDSSGRGHTGAFVNSPTWVSGRIGTGALSFDGVSSFVRIPSSTDFDFNVTGEFSISAWVYSKDTVNRVTAVGRSMDNLFHLWVIEQINSTRFDLEYVHRLIVGESSSRGRGLGLSYSANAWHHVVGVKTSGGIVRIYIDGVKGTDSDAIPNPDPDLSGLNVTIGSRRSVTPDSVWNGYIDDVRIYNRALSLAEVNELYNSDSRDTISPTVSLTAPISGSTLSGSSVAVSATAYDDVGVVGVQFRMDGILLGAEDTSSPYSITWDTTTASNGNHALTAVARDAAGHQTTSDAIAVMLSNMGRAADITVWRPSSGVWYVLPSDSPGSYTSTSWGLESDVPILGDYDGDGRSDVAVWRPGDGTWYILPSSDSGNYISTPWGINSDIPIPGDYDGDGVDDPAVWRQGSGTWFMLQSGTPGDFTATSWGMDADIPVPGDYDGDGKADIAVWRADSGTWFVLESANPGSYTSMQWGIASDIPTPGDYDGDGKTDIAVWRPGEGTWYILPSGTPESYLVTAWGTNGDTPVSGDYDGDGKTDIAVWRPDSGTWFILSSKTPGSYTATQWGIGTDVPISALTGILNAIP
jgi:hypothetical protein